MTSNSKQATKVEMDPVKKRMVFNYPDEIVYTGDIIKGPDERYKMTEDGAMFIEPSTLL